MTQPNDTTPAPAASLLAQIRAATSVSHERAESLVGMPQSLAAHVQTLKIFYGFIEPWEVKISKPLASLETQLLGRQKTPLLLQDLKNLGMSESGLQAIPRCDRLPALRDLPTALGSMYVFEGATLGGQLISRHIESALGLQDGTGYSFYQSYGAAVGVMWREYGRLLTKTIPAKEFDAVIQSARDTFDCLCNFFEEQPND